MSEVKILVVDDDRDIVRAIQLHLKEAGMDSIAAYHGAEALQYLENDPTIALVLLDIMMPELDGHKVLQKIRESKNLPVIFLSAKAEQSDKIFGFSLGADDYITKPFSPPELVARVKSHLRRYTRLGSRPTPGLLVVGGLELDPATRRVTVDGAEVQLTSLEYRILHFLVRNKDQVFSSREIYESVWGDEGTGAENTIAVHIYHIREKIEINPRDPDYLKVVWGQGYKICSEDHR